MPNEETYLESTEDVMDEDMLDPQRIEIIDDDTTHEVSEVLYFIEIKGRKLVVFNRRVFHFSSFRRKTELFDWCR